MKGFGEDGNGDFPVEPSVGDKRPREDENDVSESLQDSNQAGVKNETSDETGNTNGLSSDTNHDGSVTQTAGATTSGLSSGYDALYIGDLQWVCCLPVRLRLLLYSEIFVFSFSAHSGRQMKICVKWRTISVLQLSSRMLLSLSTK